MMQLSRDNYMLLVTDSVGYEVDGVMQITKYTLHMMTVFKEARSRTTPSTILRLTCQ